MRRSSEEDLRAEFRRACEDFENAQQISNQDAERARRLFRSSAQRFESLSASGIRNGYLEYNLGNGYLQAGDVGLAVLHYRRAERWIPNDPALRENLGTARARCLTPLAEARGRAFWRSVLLWHHLLSAGTRTGIAVGFYLGAWLALGLALLVPRRWVHVSAGVCAMLCLAFGASIGVSHWQDRNAPAGVVLSPDTPVLKGPGAGYPRQFEQPLQPGVEFTVRERRGSWWSIELPNNQSGWIEASRAELVAGAASDRNALSQ